MKFKNYILLILLLTSVRCAAQPYQSMFGSNSTYWVVTSSNLPGTYHDTIFVNKDTTINGKLYKKIVIGSYASEYGFLREDQDSGKVWQLSADYQCETLQFDFSLQQGDTFKENPDHGLLHPADCGVVDSIRYISGLKYLYFNCKYLYFNEPITFIEGIGSNINIVTSICGNSSGLTKSYVLCTYKDGQRTSYKNRYYNGDCWRFSDVETGPIFQNQISLYPQPAKEILYIRNDIQEKIIGFQIINVLGVTVQQSTQAQAITGINISGIPTGYYYIKLYTYNHHVITKPLIIE